MLSASLLGCCALFVKSMGNALLCDFSTCLMNCFAHAHALS
ncbi:hypothetical protein COLO4_29936 [Corchorus olitorius]|uniref:Uncharacterized protein n=1 Tax=Corchorus olitorius TaxID=93759 RepID=A0A1R3HCD3_9ROSI|nr:hypothetical protein COLO4_29936 [Corchorus olitorius]